jgi:predicted acylesterase/phospholipase RssA
MPDILVSVPRTCASTFEFHKSEELIAYGKQAFIEQLELYQSSKKK